MAIDHKALKSINSLKKALRNAPITVTARIAAGAAPAMSTLAQGAHASGKTVYDRPRPRGVDGDELSLKRTGATERALNFIATGRDIRTAQLPRYAKYLISKFDILPNGPLPQSWREGLQKIASRVLTDEIKGTTEMKLSDAIALQEESYVHGAQRGQTVSGITGTMAAALADQACVFGWQYPAAALRKFRVRWLHLHYVTLAAYTTPVTAGRRLHLKRGAGGAYTSGTALDVVRDQSDIAATNETAMVGQIATTGALTTTGVTFETPVRFRLLLAQAGNAGNDYDEIWAPVGGGAVLLPGQSLALLAGQAFDAVGTWQLSVKGGGIEIP